MTSSRRNFTTFLSNICFKNYNLQTKLAKDYGEGFPSNYVNDVLSSFMLNGLWDDKSSVCWNTITIWKYLERYWLRALSLVYKVEFLNIIEWWCNESSPIWCSTLRFSALSVNDLMALDWRWDLNFPFNYILVTRPIWY